MIWRAVTRMSLRAKYAGDHPVAFEPLEAHQLDLPRKYPVIVAGAKFVNTLCPIRRDTVFNHT